MDYSKMSDDALLGAIKSLISRERRAVADSLACMVEGQRRGTFGKTRHATLFSFCVAELGLSAGAAQVRVHAAKVARRHPEVYDMIASGETHLYAVAKIEPFLDSRPGLLQEIRGKSAREVDSILARNCPQPPRRETIRIVCVEPKTARPPEASREEPELFSAPRCPEPPAAASLMTGPPVEAASLMVELRFTATLAFQKQVERLKAALGHKFPGGRLEDVLGEAVREFLDRRDPGRPRRASVAKVSGQPSRRIPVAVRRQVRLRDGDPCAYLAADLRRCEETRGLQVDHVRPYAFGGASDDPANLRLLCVAHNRAEARRLGLGLQLG